RSSTFRATAWLMPRLRSIGFMPAATDLVPSRAMAWASTVAVVVLSPAVSLVLEATSLTIWAPMFSNLSESSISLATDTPSFDTRGAPNDLSSTTLRPFGPSVTLTASARMSTPRSMRSRASPPNLTSLAAMVTLQWLIGDWLVNRLYLRRPAFFAGAAALAGALRGAGFFAAALAAGLAAAAFAGAFLPAAAFLAGVAGRAAAFAALPGLAFAALAAGFAVLAAGLAAFADVLAPAVL